MAMAWLRSCRAGHARRARPRIASLPGALTVPLSLHPGALTRASCAPDRALAPTRRALLCPRAFAAPAVPHLARATHCR